MKNIGSYPKIRLRRNRKANWSRRLVRENSLSPNDLIWPIFIREGKNIKEPIKSMPGVFRYSLDKINNLIEKAISKKIPMIALFPNTPAHKKNSKGTEALNKNNLICKALKLIKKNYDEIGIMCDVALDPYTDHGHDGILKNNSVDNDETIKMLVKQSILQANMGCDVIAPSDMMDGRIGEIRKALDKNNHKSVQILSYAVKYASSFYGPFRDAVGSKKSLKGNKKDYQMDFNNSKESLREVSLDISEGADFVMVKPGMPYLDIIKLVKENFKIPVFAYQVSGEYSLIKNGINNKVLNEDAVYEALLDASVVPLRSVVYEDFHKSTKVFLNGKLVGIEYNPSQLYRYMRLLKLNSIINITTSISWNIQGNELHFFTDSGRIVRPVFYLKEDENSDLYNKVIKKVKSFLIKFTTNFINKNYRKLISYFFKQQNLRDFYSH